MNPGFDRLERSISELQRRSPTFIACSPTIKVKYREAKSTGLRTLSRFSAMNRAAISPKMQARAPRWRNSRNERRTDDQRCHSRRAHEVLAATSATRSDWQLPEVAWAEELLVLGEEAQEPRGAEQSAGDGRVLKCDVAELEINAPDRDCERHDPRDQARVPGSEGDRRVAPPSHPRRHSADASNLVAHQPQLRKFR